jgi:hypothetical protein
MIIIAILLALLSLTCFTPIIIALLDCYWWMMTEHTITSYAYDGNRFLGLMMFTVIGFVLSLLTLDAITHIDTGDNNGDKQTNDDTETSND